MDVSVNTVTLKAPSPDHKSVTVPGGFNYKVNHDQLIMVHPSHVAACRSVGFKTPEEAMSDIERRRKELRDEMARLDAMEKAAPEEAKTSAPAQASAKK
jgi:nicotinate-nucleotide pyrophosphorylase